ncbi:DUF4255 domain-containing protein [Sorangium sp. So ce1151]|uniref:DUF4255 domain-containing protein n=1 Tax=Sorangium sp. So ce1151 TaxID=3133332 RepID=UPI003F5F76F7
MASDHAISALSLALRGLLLDARPKTGELKDTAVDLYLPENFKATPPLTVSIFLYRTTVSTARRNLPPKIAADGKKYRPPLPLDLHYLITPWAKKPETQQILLAWTMRVLDDTPTLSSGYLNSFDPNNEPFGPEETVDLVYEPVSIQDMLAIWEVGKPNVQPSATYVARVVPIDSHVLMPDPGGRPVQTRV